MRPVSHPLILIGAKTGYNLILVYLSIKYYTMKNLVRAIIAGIGAKKIGGGKCGCIGTIVVFIILYWLLGYVFNAF